MLRIRIRLPQLAESSMMASYARLKKQLETLQAQVESARQAELLPIIKRMQREMATHGISVADFGAVPDTAKRVAKKVAGKRSVRGAGAPKFRDPKSGLTWSGFGRAPGWIASVRDRTKFLIDGSERAKGTPPASPKATSKSSSASKKVSAKKSVGKKTAKMEKRTAGPTPAKKTAKKGIAAARKDAASQTQTDDSAQPST